MKSTLQLPKWVIGTGILLAAWAGCKQPNGGSNQAFCSYESVPERTNGKLSCEKSLSPDHQSTLTANLMDNHGITCSNPGDTVKISGLKVDWERDGEGGWNLMAAKATVQYANNPSVTRDLNETHGDWLEGIIEENYCPKGPSCPDPEPCELCEDINMPCNYSVTTTGIIIAVVSDISGGSNPK